MNKIKNITKELLKQIIGHSENMDTSGTYSHKVHRALERVANELEYIFNELL